MSRHMISVETFFTNSLDIRIRCIKKKNEFIKNTLNREKASTNKRLDKICFFRSRSDKERDEHLTRLQEVQRMHSFLHQMSDNATVLYHEKVSISKLCCDDEIHLINESALRRIDDL